MCLYIDKDAVALVAEEDIEVYKVLHYHKRCDGYWSQLGYWSPFQKYHYRLGVVHTSELKTWIKTIGSAEDETSNAFYYTDYTSVRAIAFKSNDGESIQCNTVEEGLHTFANREDAMAYIVSKHYLTKIMDKSIVYKIVRCIIPKGSSYYKGFWPYSAPADSCASVDIAVVSYASSQLIALDAIED